MAVLEKQPGRSGALQLPLPCWNRVRCEARERRLAGTETLRCGSAGEAQSEGQPGRDLARPERHRPAARGEHARQGPQGGERCQRLDLLDGDMAGIAERGGAQRPGVDKRDGNAPALQRKRAAHADDSAADDDDAARG
jgi:hypothetical protein